MRSPHGRLSTRALGGAEADRRCGERLRSSGRRGPKSRPHARSFGGPVRLRGAPRSLRSSGLGPRPNPEGRSERPRSSKRGGRPPASKGLRRSFGPNAARPGARSRRAVGKRSVPGGRRSRCSAESRPARGGRRSRLSAESLLPRPAFRSRLMGGRGPRSRFMGGRDPESRLTGGRDPRSRFTGGRDVRSRRVVGPRSASGGRRSRPGFVGPSGRRSLVDGPRDEGRELLGRLPRGASRLARLRSGRRRESRRCMLGPPLGSGMDIAQARRWPRVEGRCHSNRIVAEVLGSAELGFRRHQCRAGCQDSPVSRNAGAQGSEHTARPRIGYLSICILRVKLRPSTVRR